MRVIKKQKNMVCNNPNCKNKVEIEINIGENQYEDNLFICKDCAKQLVKEINKNLK